jgi:hypothetical protein
MSPTSRVDSWRATSSMSTTLNGHGKRKAPTMSPMSVERRTKALKLEDEEDYGTEDEDAMDVSDGEHLEDYDQDSVPKSPTPSDFEGEGDTSLVVSEEYTSPHRRKLISPTNEFFDRGISADQLHEEGWDDDHVVLMQKIAMRGYEPILPQFYKLAWPFIPDALFTDDDNAFLSSVRGNHFHAEKALGKLCEMGPRMRDRIKCRSRIPPEEQARISVREYMDWALKDARLDSKTAIPLLAIETGPKTLPLVELQARARRKVARLASRYREAYRVKQSIEGSPVSRTSTILTDQVPTLYVIIASVTTVGVMGYRPHDAEPDLRSVAVFPMGDKNYDVWNALAIALVVCHLRNVQMRIAEDMGIGVKIDDGFMDVANDPDA